jgi:hypothetical protein
VLSATLLLTNLVVRGATFVWLDAARTDVLLKDVGLTDRNLHAVLRNEAGTKLYINVGAPTPPAGDTLVCVVSAEGSYTKRERGGRPILADDGSVLCRITNHTLLFADGHTMAFTVSNHFAFSPGGRFLAFGSFDRSGRTAIFETKRPSEPVAWLPAGYAPREIFAAADRLFVFGYKRAAADKGRPQNWGVVLSRRENGYKLDRELEPGCVTEMDTDRGIALVQSGNDLYQRWCLYDLAAGSSEPIGPTRGRGFFLDETFAGYLEKRWGGGVK